MNHEQFRKLIKLFEDRRDDVDYEDNDTQVTANLGGYQSQSYTKLGQKIAEIERKQKEIDQLKQEVKADTREYIAELFDAADAVKTRVVRTKSFYFQLSKDPAPTVSPKYKEILAALEEHLTPQLLEVLTKLKEELVTVTQKAASLKSRPLDESAHSSFAAQVDKWADSYDHALDTLEQELDSVAQGVVENDYSPMTKDSMKQDRIRSLKNLIDLYRKKGRHLRVQELELELQRLQGVTEDYDDDDEFVDQGFFVAIGNEEDGGFVGMIYKEGGKWREQTIKGTAPHNWGTSYMGYLSPEDVMGWIEKDYSRQHYHVGGPFETQEEAEDYAEYMFNLDEAQYQGSWSTTRSNCT